MRSIPLRLGIFAAPYHPLEENPTLALERDLQLAELGDALGFSEIWYGEHHSAGYEIISAPELMIAAAAQRTKRIKLASGVISVPYHNPLTTANRVAQLDHLTRGRYIFGAGPGLLPSDSHMLALDLTKGRGKFDEGLELILRLLAGEWVTQKSSWFDLRDAHCQVLPLNPEMEVCVASTFSPNGGRLAAKYNAGMLCMASTVFGGDYDALTNNWRIARESALERNVVKSPACVRCVTVMHIAETREDALKQVRAGFALYQKYMSNVLGSGPGAPGSSTLEDLIERNEVVIGTPDDAVAQIRRLEERVPDFGCLVVFANNWANTRDTHHSLEMIARYVLPVVNSTNRNRERSFNWFGENREQFLETFNIGNKMAFEKQN